LKNNEKYMFPVARIELQIATLEAHKREPSHYNTKEKFMELSYYKNYNLY